MGRREVRVAEVRHHKKQLLVRFEDLDPEAVDALIGANVVGDRAAVALAPDEYFDDDLIGCVLVDPAGNELGAVVDLLHYPAADTLVVGPRRGLVPLVSAFIRSVDPGRKRIEVDLPEGLLE